MDKEVVEQDFLTKCRYMVENEVPIWVGEFGPVYIGESETDAMRYQLLQDQLDIYAHHQASWAIWTWKDLGCQALLQVSPESSWLRRIRPALDKKTRLGVDFWGGQDTHVRNVMEPIEQTFATEFPDYDPFPLGAQRKITRLVRTILLAEPLVEEFAECFRGMDRDGIEEIMQSFKFENCVQREKLCQILANSAST